MFLDIAGKSIRKNRRIEERIDLTEIGLVIRIKRIKKDIVLLFLELGMNNIHVEYERNLL